MADFDLSSVVKLCDDRDACFNVSITFDERTSNETSSVDITSKDATWILTSAIIIFTMQTGFGLLEAGCVHIKSEINIMVKNALDVVFGGVTYWAFGFAFSFGDRALSNPFIGVGYFFVDVPEEDVGYIYALFLFQLSFATTATTIVSGAMAERTRLIAYNLFSMCMTFIYSIPAHWIWADNGFLVALGAQDIAGCGPVHLVGGITGLVATLMIGPRKGAFDAEERQPMPSPLKAILGMFMLWWGWLRFNSGSVFVVSSAEQWKYAVRAAVNTIISSIGGGISSVFASLTMSRCAKREKRFPYDISTIVNGVLGSLVSITAICTLCDPWEAFLIGCIGAVITVPSEMITSKLKIDDPVGVIPVHAVCAIWGLLAVGLFIPEKESTIEGQGGLFKTGQFYLVGIQLLSVVVIISWTVIFASLFLKVIDLAVGLRLPEEHELIGADLIEHGIGGADMIVDDTLESVVSLTTLGENAMSAEFKNKVNQLLKDFFKSICRNELYLTMTQTEAGTLGFEIKATATSTSEIKSERTEEEEDTKQEEDTPTSAEVKRTSSRLKSLLCCKNETTKTARRPKRGRRVIPMTHFQAQQARAATSLDSNVRPRSRQSALHVNVLRIGPNGVAMQVADEHGRATTRFAGPTEEGRPSSSGFEAVAAPF